MNATSSSQPSLISCQICCVSVLHRKQADVAYCVKGMADVLSLVNDKRPGLVRELNDIRPLCCLVAQCQSPRGQIEATISLPAASITQPALSDADLYRCDTPSFVC